MGKMESSDSVPIRVSRINIRYAALIMDVLNDNARDELVRDLVELGYDFDKNGESEEKVRVVRGYMQDFGAKAGLSKSAVQLGTRILYAMRAVTVIKTGSPKSPTVALVSFTPTKQDYEMFLERSEQLGRKAAPTRTDAVLDEIRNLRNRVTYLEKHLGITTQENQEPLDGRIDGTNL